MAGAGPRDKGSPGPHLPPFGGKFGFRKGFCNCKIILITNFKGEGGLNNLLRCISREIKKAQKGTTKYLHSPYCPSF